MTIAGIDPQLATMPNVFVMATTETYELGFDTTNPAWVGDPPFSPTFTLTDVETGFETTLPDAPTIDGNVVLQVVRGSSLEGNHKYTLALNFSANLVTEPLMVLVIEVPQ